MRKASVWKIALALFIGCVYIFLFGIVQTVTVEANNEFSVSVDIPTVTTPVTVETPSSSTIKLQNVYKPSFEDYIPETTVEITTPPETTTEDNVIRPPESQTDPVITTPPPETVTTTTTTTPPPETEVTPAPEWNETPVNGVRYVNENCYSRKKALLGAETVKAYSVNDKVTVVAKTDTGYYKLSDGSFIHEDYLSESEIVTTTTPPETTPPPSDDNNGGVDAGSDQVYVFNADTEEYFACTMSELMAMADDDTLIGYDQYQQVTVENGKFVVTHTWDFNNPDYTYLYVVGSAREIIIEAVVAEISDWYAEEAIKAQAICDYTYLRKKNIYGTIPPIHLVSYNYNRSRVEKCVDAVLGLAVYYNGEMIQSTFTAATPGYTNSSYDVWGVHYPYLVSVDSSWEMNYDTFKKVGARFDSSYIKQRVKDVLGIELKGSPANWFSIKDTLESTEYGWVTSVAVGGKTTYGNGKKITGRVIREQVLDFAIVSPAFTVGYDESSDELIFYIYGSGHGVGFSQFGAHIAAQDMGWKYDRILYHYFPGTEIK
ncbi:MAG: SpoIID/LytB domain-containing protein [Ruminococcaceae bacterium]|nr:SpoIID/LytB domain-containing protein [Oscillospiraceae bacterium]